MKHLLLLFLFPLFVYSQYCPYLGPNQILPCGVNSTTLTADLSQCGNGSNPNQTTNYNVSQIPFVNQTNNGTLVQLTDDSQSGIFNIGFTFCFYGQTYTQFRIGSNGWVSLGNGVQPFTFASVSIPTANAVVPKNCIMGPWQDWNPGIGGQIRYQTTGVAPCRKLTVSWIGVPMFSCTNLQGTFHIVLYESTNIIENYLVNKPNCPQWALGTSVQGIHNSTGTLAVSVAGRNSTQWTAVNDARRYTPSGPAVLPTLTWFQVGNPVPIATNVPSITVTPPPGGANYTCQLVYPSCNAGWSTCNAGVGLGPDTVLVVPGPPVLPQPTVVTSDPHCNNGCDGTINITPNGGTGVTNISWNGQGVGFNLVNQCAGTYTYNLIDAAGCTYSSSVTLNNPPPLQQPTITPTNPTCFGYNNGSAIVNPTSGVPPYTFLWNNGQTTQTATNLLSGNYSVTVYDLYNCPATQNTTLVDPPMVTINPITGLDTVCYNSTSNLYNVSSVFPNLTYTWTSTIGNITSGQGTNQINLNVTGVNAGLYNNALSVIGSNQLGCLSSPQTFNLFVLNILPVITQVGPFCEYDNCINLNATPVGGNFSGMNVWNGQYCPDNGFIGIDTVNYTYNQSGCWFDTTINVQVYPRPTINTVIDGVVGENTQFLEICDGDSLTITYGAVSPSAGYNEWNVFNNIIQGPTVNVTWDSDGVYSFDVVRWDNGCVSNPQTITVTLTLCPNEIFYIPNSFTPDNNEYNQTFKPVFTSGIDPYDFRFTIYNRWGQLIWESYDISSSWDGTYNGIKCQDGVYSWVLQFGVPKTDEKKLFTGSLTIIR